MLTTGIAKERIKTRHGNSVVLLSEYAGMHYEHTFVCSSDHKWSARIGNVINGAGCPTCWSAKRAILQTDRAEQASLAYVERLKALHPTIVSLEKYKTAHTPIKHQCTVCHVTEVKRPNEYLNGAGCRTCSYVTRADDTFKRHRRLYKRWLRQAFGRRIRLVEYSVTSLIARFCCTTCAHVWTNDRWDFREIRPWCPNCEKPRLHKQYTFPSGRQELVLGYEGWALDLLLADGVDEDVIACGRNGRHQIPVFGYELNGRCHRYYPDILVRDDHVIEVKGKYTFAGDESTFERNTVKAKAVLASHRFTLVLFSDKGERINLPELWYEMSFKEIEGIIYEGNRCSA